MTPTAGPNPTPTDPVPAPHTSLSRRSVLAGAAALGAVGLTGAGIGLAGPAAAASSPTRFSGLFREVDDKAGVPAASRHDYGVTPASVMWFDNWGSGAAFPLAQARSLWSQGVMPHYTWEPWNPALGLTDPAQITLAKIVDGRYDAYATARAREFAALGSPLLVRFAHEFNGNWYPWAIANNGEDPDLFIAAFRHVHDVVTAAGATNVQWSWTYNNGPSPVAPWNQAQDAYPGARYVDWIGLDAYNWGFGPSWDPGVDHWQSFSAMVGDAYALARSIDPAKPVMLGEFASTVDGGNKAAWLRQMAYDLAGGAFPDLRLLTYFDIDKEERWSLAQQAAGIRSFTRSHRSAFAGNGRQLATLANGYRPAG